jgi:RND family efflux transporter MFP subunit
MDAAALRIDLNRSLREDSKVSSNRMANQLGNYLMRHWWVAALVATVVILVIGFRSTKSDDAKLPVTTTEKGAPQAIAEAPANESPSDATKTRVTVVHPRTGGLARTSREPAVVESFDYAELYSKVSGYLEKQSVDIGAQVHVGQVLAQIFNPELVQELHQAEAEKEQAQAQAQQMEAAVTTAKAELESGRAIVKQNEADLSRTAANIRFRDIQYKRILDLSKANAIEMRLVDEKHEQLDAAEAAQNVAIATIAASKADVGAKQAKVLQAEADVVNAKAKIQVAAANVEKAAVFVNYCKIVSPYNGYVTVRSFHVGDFIRAADQGARIPLLTVARTDVMRIVVKIPEAYVPYTTTGDAATIELDALGGRKIPAKISRVANSLDRVDKTMRVEMDVKNTKNQLRDGMYGYAVVQLATDKSLTVPSSSIVNDPAKKFPTVFVVRDGRAHRVRVTVGTDDGINAAILSGLQSDDLVVTQPGGDLVDGSSVQSELSGADQTTAKS